jgi:hypothetical protein
LKKDSFESHIAKITLLGSVYILQSDKQGRALGVPTFVRKGEHTPCRISHARAAAARPAWVKFLIFGIIYCFHSSVSVSSFSLLFSFSLFFLRNYSVVSIIERLLPYRIDIRISIIWCISDRSLQCSSASVFPLKNGCFILGTSRSIYYSALFE